MPARVSAVIPCKDRLNLLDRALTSIAAQTVPPDEIVVVDDGSDPPLTLARDYPTPIILIRQSNRGPAAARNRGIDRASGEWIALLDSDDTWMPEKTDYQLDLLSRHEQAGFCVSNMVTHGRPSVSFPLAPSSGAPEGLIPDALERLLPGRFINTSGVMFRREAFYRAGAFDEDLWYCEDYDLWMRLAAVTPVVATTKCLSDVYVEGDNHLGAIEGKPVSVEIIASIFEKLMISPLLDTRTREQAADLLGHKLFDLAYTYRKHGQPLACCRASFKSLLHHGPLKANLKNFVLCWPDLLLRLTQSR